uniref:(northern house mosquito) hypothetical protein n=1 Tax=Culex pipiens TaxID=7175 RepID=A0A8D8C6F0_CULPI
MWPLILQFLRSNVAYITLPIAGIVGVIGYNIESLLSDKYTPYSGKREIGLFTEGSLRFFYSFDELSFAASIQEQRAERTTDDENLKNAADVEKLVYRENVLGRNLSPSLDSSKK